MNNRQLTITGYWQGNLLHWMGRVSWNLGHHRFQPQYYLLSSALQILLSESELQYEQHHPVPNLHYTCNIKPKHCVLVKIKKIYASMSTPSNSVAFLPLLSAIFIWSLVGLQYFTGNKWKANKLWMCKVSKAPTGDRRKSYMLRMSFEVKYFLLPWCVEKCSLDKAMVHEQAWIQSDCTTCNYITWFIWY